MSSSYLWGQVEYPYNYKVPVFFFFAHTSEEFLNSDRQQYEHQTQQTQTNLANVRQGAELAFVATALRLRAYYPAHNLTRTSRDGGRYGGREFALPQQTTRLD